MSLLGRNGAIVCLGHRGGDFGMGGGLLGCRDGLVDPVHEFLLGHRPVGQRLVHQLGSHQRPGREGGLGGGIGLGGGSGDLLGLLDGGRIVLLDPLVQVVGILHGLRHGLALVDVVAGPGGHGGSQILDGSRISRLCLLHGRLEIGLCPRVPAVGSQHLGGLLLDGGSGRGSLLRLGRQDGGRFMIAELVGCLCSGREFLARARLVGGLLLGRGDSSLGLLLGAHRGLLLLPGALGHQGDGAYGDLALARGDHAGADGVVGHHGQLDAIQIPIGDRIAVGSGILQDPEVTKCLWIVLP